MAIFFSLFLSARPHENHFSVFTIFLSGYFYMTNKRTHNQHLTSRLWLSNGIWFTLIVSVMLRNSSVESFIHWCQLYRHWKRGVKGCVWDYLRAGMMRIFFFKKKNVKFDTKMKLSWKRIRDVALVILKNMRLLCWKSLRNLSASVFFFLRLIWRCK